jgi:hypothetical protein
MDEIVFFLELTRTSILDDVDLLTENRGPIAPPKLRSVYFDVVVEAGRPGFDADSFRQGLQEALVQDPDRHRQLDRRLTAVGQLAGVGAALVRD